MSPQLKGTGPENPAWERTGTDLKSGSCEVSMLTFVFGEEINQSQSVETGV
jgi:hypothetical protein